MKLSELVRRYLLYGLSGPIIALNLWVLGQLFSYFEGIITFTTLSAVLALLLNYIVRFFQRIGFNRTQAILLVLSSFLIVVIVSAVTLIPIVADQATQILQGLPRLLEAGNRNLTWFQNLINERQLPLDLNQIVTQATSQIQGTVGLLPELAVNTLGQVFATIFLIVLAFYMLLYGDRFWHGIISLLPEKLGTALSDSLQQQFHQFFLTQLLLSLVMVLFLLPIFLVLQIRYSLSFALLIGFFEIVPLFGATIGIGIVTLLALGIQGYWTAAQILISGVFFQQITDNIIAPRLRGNFTGLNPIWVVVALLVGFRVAGFLGVVLAMPIAATIKSTIEVMRSVDRRRGNLVPPEPPSLH
ncbi:MAG: AI-2E family transporter [Drouetiella hepatica Uher 2000/2452]|jgi:predicted PurR-regulated permease PerM|uniref:AI-2E family transporter n=1 Tax=Drouetiella hepatica Uher 2000/2452 TaxID=904376 RepID=A0A951UKV1_9CYAN|nr:AI-2E family transporter [Drouetiella hepatica Uher 2000/2452]